MASPSSSYGTTVMLRCSDGAEVKVDVRVAMNSNTLRLILRRNKPEVYNTIPLPNVNSGVLQKVIDYCCMHAGSSADEDALKTWDAEFVKGFDVEGLFELLTAANYLEIKGLMDLALRTTADLYKAEQEQSSAAKELFRRKKRAFGMLFLIFLMLVIVFAMLVLVYVRSSRRSWF